MIATHNIKIGGRWYKAGEEINSSADFMNTPEIPEYGEKKFTKINAWSGIRWKKLNVVVLSHQN